MATATTKSNGIVVTLELDEEEAVYVWAALNRANPTRLVDDPVYDALGNALDAAGISYDASAAS